MLKRKYYKQVIQIEVLSEDLPIEWDSLRDIDYEITVGGSSGRIEEISCECVDEETIKQLLIDQCSDPGFFDLTHDEDDDDE